MVRGLGLGQGIIEIAIPSSFISGWIEKGGKGDFDPFLLLVKLPLKTSWSWNLIHFCLQEMLSPLTCWTFLARFPEQGFVWYTHCSPRTLTNLLDLSVIMHEPDMYPNVQLTVPLAAYCRTSYYPSWEKFDLHCTFKNSSKDTLGALVHSFQTPFN